jgi:hypothetical protein
MRPLVWPVVRQKTSVAFRFGDGLPQQEEEDE